MVSNTSVKFWKSTYFWFVLYIYRCAFDTTLLPQDPTIAPRSNEDINASNEHPMGKNKYKDILVSWLYTYSYMF